MATGYAFTRPDADQVKFTSAKTGEHVLEDYLQAAELGDRTLAELLADVFNPTTGELLDLATPTQITQSFDNAAAALASQQAAALSAAEAAASAVSIAGGPVTSVNGATGEVTGIADLTGAQELSNKKLRAVYVVGKSVVNAVATGTVTLDLSTSSDFSLTLSGDTTVVLNNLPALSNENYAFIVKVTQGGTARTLTWFGSITWLTVGGTAPAAPAASKTIEYIFTTDGSGVFFGRKGAAT